jgi:hypothetical protein
MPKKYCDICETETDHKEVKDKTPQGWDMLIDECQKCKLRVLLKEPKPASEK